ncbi:MAG: hypothetical protein KY463_08445, partial [Actinobacteria bacterium]|nr:hypothetical protein [Actinomycetota bacterium]
VAVVLVIKLVRVTDSLGYGAYSAILAAILVAYGGYLIASQPGQPGQPGEPGEPGGPRQPGEPRQPGDRV